ncbi:hypothetical protein BJ138DRAFT_1156112 [Hygrophoropsis aurantiaca]|uniref:Uncharacterized protein n=1 Tax=Hygrophoropsis aurantiaca TaxID=72124 RepID=A0ACB8A7A9_9AGAM|nr:hypothetical protein BJ138DRAFT_1156112 [Hygrophoropsis aurantiaca]
MLHELISLDERPHLPVLVLGNKIDLVGAVSEEELRLQLGLEQTEACLQDLRSVEVFMCSVQLRSGYIEGFKWLLQQMRPG